MSNLSSNREARLIRLRFSNLLKKYRELSPTSLTQKRVAAKLGVSDKTLRNWENDIELPTARRLKKLVETYFELGLLTPGNELEEMKQLWLDRQMEGRANVVPGVDEEWFGAYLCQRKPPLVPVAQLQNKRYVPARATSAPVDTTAAARLNQPTGPDMA